MRQTKIWHEVTIVAAVLTLITASMASAQSATFVRITDSVQGRCYDPATTAPDTGNPNRLVIGIHSDPVADPFGNSVGCVASDEGPTLTTDTISFYVEAPPDHYIAKITFTQAGSTFGSRGGRGFRSTNWVVADRAYTVPVTPEGWEGSVDLSHERKTLIPISITTYLAAFGGSVLSGSATASDPAVQVDVLPLQGDAVGPTQAAASSLP